MLYAVHITEFNRIAKKNGLCSVTEVEVSPEMYYVYKIYAWTRIILSVLIDVCLILTTIMTVRTINKNLDRIFQKEKRRIMLINATFATAYCSWMVNDIIIATTKLPGAFVTMELNMIINILFTMLPISLVFYTHFSNVHSVHRIFK